MSQPSDAHSPEAPPSAAEDRGADPGPPDEDQGQEAPSPADRAAARGRRTAFILYFSLAGAIGIAGAIQIFQQAFTRQMPAEGRPASCEEGLRRMADAVERARSAASATDGEDAAVARFRAALRPEWDHRDTVAQLCAEPAASSSALDAIERLRYAEEHAVRREAADLAPVRRRVQAILGTGSASPPPAPSDLP